MIIIVALVFRSYLTKQPKLQTTPCSLSNNSCFLVQMMIRQLDDPGLSSWHALDQTGVSTDSAVTNILKVRRVPLGE